MVLDTNSYSALALGTRSIVELITDVPELEIPLPVIAELRYGFLNGSKPEKNEQTLQRFLAQSNVSILEPNMETTNHYAELQLFCKKHGKALSQNDIWIGALAQQHNSTLVTFDKDFQVLRPLIGNLLVILP